MAKLKQKIFAVLDIGSTKIVCFIARVDANGRLEVIGTGHQVSQGIRAGIITDIRAAESAILAAVHAAEQMAEINVENIVVNISGHKIISHTLVVGESVHGREIGERDIERLVAEGYNKFSQEPYEVIHCIPIDYILDEEAGIKDPRGMYGSVLKARLHIITTLSTSLLNLSNCLARCHLNIAECIVSPYASGLACLTEDERELGTTLLDMGGGHTSIAVFRNGHIVHTDSVALGGVHITSDIAWGLSTNLANAERIKTLYGNAVSTAADQKEMINVPQLGEENDDSRYVPRSKISEILRPRMEEILDMVRKRLLDSGLGMASGRIVLTGGASQLTGLKELASHIFNTQVRMATPKAVAGLAENTKGAAFATSIGILQFIADKPDDMLYGVNSGGAGENYMGRFVGWFKNNF